MGSFPADECDYTSRSSARGQGVGEPPAEGFCRRGTLEKGFRPALPPLDTRPLGAGRGFLSAARPNGGPAGGPCYDPTVEVLLAVLLTGASAQGSLSRTQAPDRPAEALARRIEERQKSLQDLQAHFVQRYRSGVLGRELVETGRLSLKPPGRMLFEYLKPEKKVFVSDGETSYFYVPEDHQVVVQNLKGERGVLFVLLSGREGILDHFAPTLEGGTDGLKRLRLTPRQPDPDVDHVLLDVDEADQIRRIEILDPAGDQSEFRFDGIRENLGLPDRLFHFTPPKDAEVIHG
jgi:outer membrane lipoprotein carrier protein